MKTDKHVQHKQWNNKMRNTMTMVLFVFVFGCGGIKQTCGAQTAEQWLEKSPWDQTNCNSPSFQTFQIQIQIQKTNTNSHFIRERCQLHLSGQNYIIIFESFTFQIFSLPTSFERL